MNGQSVDARKDKGRILVVDDDETVAEVVSGYLRSAGFAVDVAHLGQDALDLARSRSYGALICDVELPDITGLQVREALEKQGSPLVRRVVFMSGSCRHLSVGGSPFLAKPFNAHQLHLALIQVLQTEL